MYAKQFLLALTLSGSVFNGVLAANDASDLTLTSDLVQKGSQNNGLDETGAEAGEAASLTDNANFINFCEGKTLTNGLQVTGGSCNGIVMGDIPSKNTMISTVILQPQTGQDIAENQDFNVTLQTNNLQAGTFTNADNTYYAAPQQLNSAGQVIGHTHVTIQDIGNLNPSTPPDPTQFAFFKGINDAGNGQGELSAAVAGGLAAGTYRVCTMTSSSNHQPVLMPVAQRGSQDDCTKFTVGQGGGNSQDAAASSSSSQAAAGGNSGSGSSSGNNGGSASGAAQAASSSQAAAGGSSGSGSSSGNNGASASGAAQASSSQAAAGGNSGSGSSSGNNGGKGSGGNNGFGGKKGGRFVRRKFIA